MTGTKEQKRAKLDLLAKICQRYEWIAEDMEVELSDRMTRMMDLESADQQFNMDWDGLLYADNGDFVHDISGIHHHVDRSTYPAVIGDCFLPRYAKAEGGA